MHDLIKKDWMRNQQNITIVKTIANTDVCAVVFPIGNKVSS